MTRLENYETLFKNIETNVKIILEALSNRLPANSEIDKYEKRAIQKVFDEIINETKQYFKQFKDSIKKIE